MNFYLCPAFLGFPYKLPHSWTTIMLLLPRKFYCIRKSSITRENEELIRITSSDLNMTDRQVLGCRRKRNPQIILIVKENSNYHTIALISHTSKVMFKILQARLQQYMNFQMFKLDLEKAEEPEIKLPKSTGSSKKQESSRKTPNFLYWLCQNLWLCGSQQTVENSERDGNTRFPDLPRKKSVCG